MPFSNALMTVGANAIRSAIKGFQLHTDNPGSGGAANKSSAPPLAPSFSTVSNDGDFSLANELTFTGAEPNGPIKYLSAWSSTNIASAIWYGNFKLTGDLTADANGHYRLEGFQADGSSSDQ